MDSDLLVELLEEVRNLTAAIVDHAEALRENTSAIRDKAEGGGEESTMD